MNKYKAPFKHFDITVTHLPEDSAHYVPARTRDADEHARRHAMPPHSLILEDQASGLVVGQHTLAHQFANQHDEEFVHRQLVASLVTTGFYSGARGAGDVMRRRWLLPEVASDEGDGWRETKAGLLSKIQDGMSYAVTLAAQLERAHKNGNKTESLRRQLGCQVGSTGIALACYDLGDAPEDMSAYDIQAIIRLRALDTIQQSRQFAPLGTYGSIAQFARQNAPASINFMRTAPRTDEAASVLAQAQEDFGLTQ